MAAQKLEIHPAVVGKPVHLPLAPSSVRAGFPPPADDCRETAPVPNSRLIRNPPAAFLVKAVGDSMIGAGIQPGDMLVVDGSLEAAGGSVVVAVMNGESTLKRFSRRRGCEGEDMPEGTDDKFCRDIARRVWRWTGKR
ncbi:MAG: LexA family transcriptional regulator [Planctomycetota bacterium]|jgi:DNA polymerase V|nr:LexA family transcriptional regulator [Planctomycetota bacterium]